MLSVACVHPKGEDDTKDTLYFCDNELASAAADLVGCPLLVEHDSEPVGKVIHAYQDKKDRKLYAIFETDPSTFGGCLAGNLVRSGLVSEVSLAHDVSIEHSQNGDRRVVGKVPTELSIVEKGARKGTKILGKSKKNPTKRYIKVQSNVINSTKSKMSATDATQIPSSEQSLASDQMMKQLLEQVKMLTEQQTLASKENEELKSANEKFATQVAEAEAVGKRKRTDLIDGSVKEYFTTLMEKYKTELAPHEAQLDSMFQSMKSNSASEPMVTALACAAAAAKGSVTELEAQYQSNKKMKTELDALKAQIAEHSKPMFANKSERVETVTALASATTSAPKTPSEFTSIFGGAVTRTPATLRGAGMREVNPAMWNDLVKNAPIGRGMPKIDAFMSMIKK